MLGTKKHYWFLSCQSVQIKISSCGCPLYLRPKYSFCYFLAIGRSIDVCHRIIWEFSSRWHLQCGFVIKSRFLIMSQAPILYVIRLFQLDSSVCTGGGIWLSQKFVLRCTNTRASFGLECHVLLPPLTAILHISCVFYLRLLSQTASASRKEVANNACDCLAGGGIRSIGWSLLVPFIGVPLNYESSILYFIFRRFSWANTFNAIV
jgi:hypothetical protein